MKWGRKKAKSATSSSSPGSVITRVLPLSWFFKFKQKRESKLRGGFYSLSPSKSLPGGWKEGRFYSRGEDDAYWRILLSRERIPGRRSTGGMNMNPLWYDSDLEFEVPLSDFKGEMDVARIGRHRNFDDMVSDIKRMKELQGSHGKHKTIPRNDGEPPKIQRSKDQSLRKFSSEGVLKERRHERGPEERDVFPIEPDRRVELEKDGWRLPVSSSRKNQSNSLSSVKEDDAFEGSFTNRKLLREIKLKPDQPQKKQPTVTSTESYSRKTKQHNNRVKAYSPRTECKIRALEEMKRSRMRWKKKGQGQVIGGETIFDSFAMVKSSSNPRQDFRDSMVEMIREKGISRAEDLEELLACYLTLNCDAYHDLIIKIFRQVWSELNTEPTIPNSQYFAYWRTV